MLIEQLLHPEIEERLTAEDALKSPFFEKYNVTVFTELTDLKNKLFKNILNIKEFTTFKRMNMMIMSELISLQNSEFLK